MSVLGTILYVIECSIAIILFYGLVFLSLHGGDIYRRLKGSVKPNFIRNPNDWRTQARGGWRTLQVGDKCYDEDGGEYLVKVIDPQQEDFRGAAFGCMSWGPDGTTTAHYKTGRDRRYETNKRDLVRIAPRTA